jgi:hypothetical protein
MLIPHVVQTEADKVFINILNNQDVALSNGDVVTWNVSTPDGVRTTQQVTTTFSLICGVADGSIAASAYGLAQCYGYKAAVLVSGDSATTVVAGAILDPVTAVDYVQGHTSASTGNSGFIIAGEAVATSAAAATYKAFLRMM